MPIDRSRPLRSLLATALVLAAVSAWAGGAAAASVPEFLATSIPGASGGVRRLAQRQNAATTASSMPTGRRWRKSAPAVAPSAASTKFFDTDDYVWSYPPTYQGPRLSADLDRQWTRFLAAQERPEEPAQEKKELPGLADFLAAARKHYGFEPTRIPEREFKRRYAEEAIALGLTKEQVVRVYALETGGDGTADMQAGIHPITKKGKPISSALGYAQLLHANTIGELVKHGDQFVKRLQRLKAGAGDPARADELHRKIAALQAMIRSARSVPDDWYRHVAFAQNSKGYGMHAINLDGDIGPWLQSLEAARPQGLRRPQGRDQPLGRGDRDHEPFGSGDGP